MVKGGCGGYWEYPFLVPNMILKIRNFDVLTHFWPFSWFYGCVTSPLQNLIIGSVCSCVRSSSKFVHFNFNFILQISIGISDTLSFFQLLIFKRLCLEKSYTYKFFDFFLNLSWDYILVKEHGYSYVLVNGTITGGTIINTDYSNSD